MFCPGAEWRNTYDRFVGACYLDEQDIGAKLTGAGLAIDSPQCSSGRYAGYGVEGRRLG